MNLRALAAQTISQVLVQGKSLADLMPHAQQKISDPRDKGLLQEIVYGVLRHYRRLGALRDTLLSQKLTQPNAPLGCLMTVGLYQLFYTRVPGHAAVAATVDAVEDIKEPKARGLVNAILRRAQREGERHFTKIDGNWELKFSHPDWYLSALKPAGREQMLAVLEANNHPAPMTLRVNTHQQTKAQYLSKLTALGINAQQHAEAADALTLDEPMDVFQLPGFKDGEVSVQDAAAQLAADYLRLAPNLSVLDACAAPGGKTAHMLEREPTLNVLAIDNDNTRLARVKENLTRLKLQAEVVCADAAKTESWAQGRCFDRILLDAPCSGTGVIRRHPDIKWLRRERDIPALAQTQLKLLTSLWPLLKNDGLLLFATCSTLPQENEEVIKAFLAQQKGAKLIPLPRQADDRIGRRILCGEQGMDGFYYALLTKTPTQE